MSSSTRKMLLVGIAIALVIAASSAFLASSHPDGLERVAENLGFLGVAQGPRYEVLPGYSVPGVGNARLSTMVAGGIGVLLVAGIAMGAGAFLRRRR